MAFGCMAGASGLLVLAGCGGPGAIAPPDWAPDDMAESAIDLYDKNSDGVLDAKELEGAPGLKAAADLPEDNSADRNGDGKLSQDEIRDLMVRFEESPLGIQMVSVRVMLDKKPLENAQIELIPEPFLEGVLKVAKGVTDSQGYARPQAEISDMKGVQPGVYKVKITAPGKNLAPRYNEQTTLGLETVPALTGYGEDAPRVFELKSS